MIVTALQRPNIIKVMIIQHNKTVFKNKGTKEIKITSDLFCNALKFRFVQTKLRWLDRKSTNSTRSALKFLISQIKRYTLINDK